MIGTVNSGYYDMIGQTISHYKVTEKLGEGGMGIVYKAEDTKLERTVALKFLAAHLVSDEEIRKRFEREAKAAAALNHPNICHVYEIDEAEGKTFIAMAFIEGQGLDAKIATGPLKLDEALDIAHQIAQGLQAAHEKGIVHRDIKPANVMITGSGSRRQLTIMDFGLAQLTEHSKLTRMDETMGTVAYMSPEQTMGAEVDRRSDIWALGVVLYEMITGQRPFKGHYDKAVMYSITNEEAEPVTALRTGVPMELEFIVGKCLAKDADSRYQTAGDLAVDLRNLQEKLKSGKSTILSTIRPPVEASNSQTASAATSAIPDPVSLIAGWKRYLPWALSALLALALLILAAMKITEPARRTEGTPLRRFAFAPEGGPTQVKISPNGRYLAYTGGAENALWVQDLTRDEPREITGITGVVSLCWSPGSDFIGFATESELRKVSVDGGQVATICALPRFDPDDADSVAWSPDGETLVFAAGPIPRLHEVSSLGGNPKLLIEPAESQSELWYFQPHFLPSDGKARQLLYALGNPFTAEIVVRDLGTGEHRVLARGYSPAYSASGHVLFNLKWYGTSDGFWALPFSMQELQARGEAFRASETGQSASVSQDGTLAYLDGSALTGGLQLFWRNRSGGRIGPAGQPQTDIQYPSLSPDGSQVAVRGSEIDSTETSIWLHGAGTPTKLRLTFARGHDSRPIWGPAENEITYPSAREGPDYNIRVQPAEGGGQDRVLVSTPLWEVPNDWSPDGRHLLYQVLDENSPSDLWLLTRNSDGSVAGTAPFLVTPYSESEAQFSPDGRYVAYESDESGRSEIYVRRFPDAGRKWLVSRNGGADPRWRADGKELFYVEGETLVAVPVNTGDEFSSGDARALFSDPALRSPRYHHYDVSPDGERFVLPSRVESGEAKLPVIRVVQNWFAEFQGRQR